MNLADRLLHDLKEKQLSFSIEALRSPGDKSQFEFGHRVGVVRGLEEALIILQNLINEDKNGGNDL